MEEIKTLLETQPLFALFLTIALGYLVGEINIKGFSLGSGAVLFVGLAIGGFAPKAAPPALLGRWACCCSSMASVSNMAPNSSAA
jgi:putative transport protein